MEVHETLVKKCLVNTSLGEDSSFASHHLSQARLCEQGLVSPLCFGGLSPGAPAFPPLWGRRLGEKLRGRKLISFSMRSSVNPLRLQLDDTAPTSV